MSKFVFVAIPTFSRTIRTFMFAECKFILKLRLSWCYNNEARNVNVRCDFEACAEWSVFVVPLRLERPRHLRLAVLDSRIDEINRTRRIFATNYDCIQTVSEFLRSLLVSTRSNSCIDLQNFEDRFSVNRRVNGSKLARNDRCLRILWNSYDSHV